MGYEQYNPSALPPPLNGRFGQLMTSTLGAQQDEEVELLATALRCRLPEKCPDDALDDLGKWFDIERYDGESHESYRARLMKAFSTWEIAGSAEAIEAQISAAFGCDVRVWPIWEINFGPDPRACYTEFWIALGPELGTYTGTIAQRVALKRLVLKWKAAHGYPVEIVVFGGDGPILGVGKISGDVLTTPLTLGDFELGGATSDRHRIGRTLGGTLPALGDSGCILGGYDLT